jgi:hypothetical protein
MGERISLASTGARFNRLGCMFADGGGDERRDVAADTDPECLSSYLLSRSSLLGGGDRDAPLLSNRGEPEKLLRLGPGLRLRNGSGDLAYRPRPSGDLNLWL